MTDQLIALDPSKCAFLYNLIRATRATTVVEVGTGWGVSTIYLALAVGANDGVKGKVIATEKEKGKAEKARENWRVCGREVEGFVELREGDLMETLGVERGGMEEVDLVLLDSKGVLFLCFVSPCLILMIRERCALAVIASYRQPDCLALCACTLLPGAVC